MQVSDPTVVLDIQQLKDITLEVDELMREVLSALIDGTSRQLSLLDAAIRQQDGKSCVRLARYSKGECANVGSNRAADTLKRLEEAAARNAFDDCTASLQFLVEELERLRHQAAAL